MVPLDRALLSSYRLSIVTIMLCVTVWPQFAMQVLTEGSDPQYDPPNLLFRGVEPGPLSNTMLLGTTLVSLLNGISFRSTLFAGCTSVTDRQTMPR